MEAGCEVTDICEWCKCLKTVSFAITRADREHLEIFQNY